LESRDTERLRLFRHDFKIFNIRIASGSKLALRKRIEKYFSKKQYIWCGRLGDFDVPNEIQSVMVWPVVSWMI
jgi:hypothetical protein